MYLIVVNGILFFQKMIDLLFDAVLLVIVELQLRVAAAETIDSLDGYYMYVLCYIICKDGHKHSFNCIVCNNQ